MASITTRAGKGTPLTNAEVDANFTNLNTELATKVDQAGARAAISAAGSLSYNSATGVLSFSDAVTSVAGKTGAVTLINADVGLGNVENKSSASIRSELTSGNVTGALGFTPYNSTNPSGFISGINSSMVTGALGYTPYNSSNPSGYITSSALSSYLPLSGGALSGGITFGSFLKIATDNSDWTTGNYFRGSTDHFVLGVQSGGTLYLNYGNESGTVRLSGTTLINNNQALHAGNYGSYALPLSGGTLSGLLNVPTGYVSNGNPWGTANSAFFPNGITTAGSNNWIYGTTYIGNAPGNGSGLEVLSNGRFYSSVSGGSAMEVRRTGSGLAPSYTALFEQDYGNHSWGIVGEFRVGGVGGSDRPSILFSHGYNSTTWSVGYGFYDDQFRIRQNHGHRNGDWGTERFRIGTEGTPYFNGNVALHAGNYTSYSPSLTGSGASGTWGINVTGSASNITAYTINQNLGISDAPTFQDTYTNGWFRNNNSGQGLYNQATYNHFYSDGSYWNVAYGGTTGIRLRNGHAGPILGYLYGETTGNFGLLHNGGGWAVQVYPGGGGNLSGGWTIGGNTPLTSSNYNSYSPTLTGGNASGTWGINVTGSAGSVAWTNVSGRPTAVSSFTNDSGYITSSASISGSSGATNAVNNTGYGDGTFTWYQTSGNHQTWTGGWASRLISSHGNGSTYYNQTLILPFWGPPQYMRKEGGHNTGPWVFLTTENYTSYSPSLTGGGASGTWGISITGNAATVSSITSGQVTGALGYTPYNSSNPSGYITSSGSISGSAGSVPWSGITSRPSNIMYYQGFTLDANTMDSNSTGFTYSSNAPHTGPVARFSTGGSYDLWLNAPYIGGGALSFRTRNGDTATLNPWRSVLHDGNYTSYSPSLTGSGASGTWGISITGSAASVTNSLSFNTAGTGNNSAATYNGSIARVISYNTIGAPSTTGANASGTWAISVSGNAASASSVATSDDTSTNATHYVALKSSTSGNLADKVSSTKLTFNPSTGGLTTGGNVVANSDERLKTDWANLPEDFIECVATVKHGTYTRIDSGERQAGSSAQDWKALLPEVVSAADDEQGTLSLAYGNAALVAAIQLAKRVVEQEARISRLEAAIQKLIGD